MRRFNVDVLMRYRIDPFGCLFVDGKHKYVDAEVIHDANFQVAIGWRN